MQNLTRSLGACMLAGLLAACSGQNTSSLLPVNTNVTNAGSTTNPQSVATTQSVTSALPDSSAIALQGTISGLRSGGFTLNTNGSAGYVPVNTTSSTTINTDGGSETAGHYAFVVGTGSTATSITANYVAAFTSEPGAVTMSGTYENATSYGFVLKTTGGAGSVPVITSSSTKLTGALSQGATISVTGDGNGSAILATSVTSGTSGASSTSTGSATSTTEQKHVVTADYFESPWGTTSVSASSAAPYLSWAETGIANTNSIAAAGIKTMVYFDGNRVQSDDPLYSVLSGSEYAETCSGARISDYWDDVTQYVTNNGSSAMRGAYASMVASETAGNTVDAIYQDDSDPLSQDPISYFSPESLPCDYSDSTWLANERTMIAGLGHPVIVNGFSKVSESVPISIATQLLSSSGTMGGNMESCYAEDHSPPEQGVWVWVDMENTSLLTTGQDKYFQCWAMDPTEASSAQTSRLYVLASFLLTYNRTYSILREDYGTPSGLHVMPESQIVPTDPVIATPSTVASLEKSDVYVREYRACYYAGKLVGQCAMVVNNDGAAHATPALSLTYHHTLSLSGNGILDGGSVSFEGAAPPSTIAAESAFVAFP
jgi:hypothetical protein